MTSKPESLYGKRIRERAEAAVVPEPDHERAFQEAMKGTLRGQMKELSRAISEATTVPAMEATKAMEALANAFGKLKRKP